MDQLRALYLLRQNIRALLMARKETETALALWCGKDKSWINKFLNERRGIQIAPVASGQVVDDDHVVAAFDQCVDEVRPDKPGAAHDGGPHTLTAWRLASPRRWATAERKSCPVCSATVDQA